MRRSMLWVVVLGLLMVGLTAGPDLWAAPGQSPARQTVPTRTPETPPEPTNEPPPSESTPVPTTVPSAVATMMAGADGVNVRSGPGTNYERLGYLDPGAQAEVIGRYGDWLQIRYNDAPGWVFGELVTVSNADSVPQVEPPPAPTAMVEATPVGAAVEATPVGVASEPLLPESGGRSIRLHLGAALIAIGLLVVVLLRRLA